MRKLSIFSVTTITRGTCANSRMRLSALAHCATKTRFWAWQAAFVVKISGDMDLRFETSRALKLSWFAWFCLTLSCLLGPAVSAGEPQSPSTREMERINWMEFREWVPGKIRTVLLPLG